MPGKRLTARPAEAKAILDGETPCVLRWDPERERGPPEEAEAESRIQEIEAEGRVQESGYERETEGLENSNADAKEIDQERRENPESSSTAARTASDREPEEQRSKDEEQAVREETARHLARILLPERSG
ncbi:hypothetical protein HO133_004140 [Letharia lupina]|uniref:Uncharacterized protein n=1 Tax=Letharia lupina TaxID=560253 RepID=A0A8H6CAM9_9LECA|nr:uncharacterized protein HO133_004140 [Letharia lupina]KAF6219671.1 hypothetical protein HO133_004140 [Letharia lupina]